MATSPQAKISGFLVATVNSLLEDLRQPCPIPHDELIRHFNLFTNDCDQVRDQSFKEACPEFYQLLLDDGYEWTDELTYAEPKAEPKKEEASAA